MGLWCALLLACTGAIGGESGAVGPEASPGKPGSEDNAPLPATNPPPSASVGQVPLRRLSRVEYRKTLADLLRVPVEEKDIAATESYGPSGYPEGGAFSPDEVDRMLAAVDTLAARYAATQLTADMPCKPQSDADRACAQAFVKAFGARAYRHPISRQETLDLMGVYDEGRKDRSLKEALSLVVRAALLSPRFNYRWEQGDNATEMKNGVIALGNYEIASRLSYFLWQSMPDETLFELAAMGELQDPQKVAKQVQRMVRDPVRGGSGIKGFFETWLPLADFAAHGPEDPNHAAKASMMVSLMAFVEDLVLGTGDATYETLLAADYVFANTTVAKLMNLEPIADNVIKRVNLNDQTRAGIFTHPAFLAATTDTPLTTVIRRGRFVYEKLGACAPVPPLVGTIPDPPARQANASVREHLSEHASSAVCRACHQFMDPMGFAFDSFDALGQARDQDDYGKPTNTQGTMPLAEGLELRFNNAADLLRQLARNDLSQACFAQQLLSYALRLPVDAGNAGAFTSVAKRFVDGGGNILSLLTTAAESELFYFRKPSPGEVLQ